MLDNEVTLQPDSIEKIFCEPFSKLPVRPFNREESAIMVSCLAADEQPERLIIDEKNPEVPNSAIMLKKSLRTRFSFEMTEPMQVMVASTCKSVGVIIMYLTYLQYWAKKHDKRKLSTSDLSNIFPMGVPTEEALHKLWDAQKVKRTERNPIGSDNLLDYQTALKSIHFDKKQN